MANSIRSTLIQQTTNFLSHWRVLQSPSPLCFPRTRCRIVSGNLSPVCSFSSSNITLSFPRPEKRRKYYKKQKNGADGVEDESLSDVVLDFEPKTISVIDINDPVHRSRLQELQDVFPKKDIKHLAIKSPQVFELPFKDIYSIVRYISFRMGLDQAEMVKAGVFDYPLEHIVRRHVFAERCGVFQRVPLKRPEMAQLNPTLGSMIRTNNFNFTRMVGVTEEEYGVFCEMFDAVEKKALNSLMEDLDSGGPRRKRGSTNLEIDSDEEDFSDSEEDEAKDENFYL